MLKLVVALVFVGVSLVATADDIKVQKCPNCGKVHALRMSDFKGSDALAELNAKRKARGLKALKHDPKLYQAALKKARIQAGRNRMYHPGGSMGGGTHEGVGVGSTFRTCYMWETRFRYAGAARVRGSSGNIYYCLILRN